jgi:hypothetical protein
LLDKCTTMVREKLFIRILEMDKWNATVFWYMKY